MRIAIVTLPLHTNYGGILQAYALQTVLERMGHEVHVLTRSHKMKISPRLLFLSIPKRFLAKMTGKRSDIFHEFKYNRIINTISKNIRPFISKYIIQDPRTFDELRPSDYDAYVVGSDQIWRPRYIKSVLRSSNNNAFLDFAKTWDVIRIAYSTSFGTNDWEYSESDTNYIKKTLIPLFKSISVREYSGVNLCKRYFGIDVDHLLDPTMLLTQEDYVKLINSYKTKPNDGELFYYLLDLTDDKISLVKRVSDERHLKPFTSVARPEDWSLDMSNRIQPPLEQWLRGIKDSKFVVTDSFHGCVFSILFHKPFIAIGNKERGLSRFESLLQTFNLMDHLLLNIDDYNSSNRYEIEDGIYMKLEQLRELSFTYLLKNL